MTDLPLRPLSEDLAPLDDFESALVSSAKHETMGGDRKRALMLALGGGAVVATVGATAGTAKAATAAGVATKAKSAAALALMKWIAAGVAGTALVAGATKGAVHVYETQRTEAATFTSSDTRGRAIKPPTHGPPNQGQALPVASAAAVDPPKVDMAATPPPPAATSHDAPPATDPPSAAAASAPAPTSASRGRSARGAVAPVATAPPSLAEEARTIERARSALAANDPVAASSALDEHDRDFARGAFAEESRVLRIDVHARRGDVARARAEARAYLAAHPTSPYAPRLRAIAGEDAPR